MCDSRDINITFNNIVWLRNFNSQLKQFKYNIWMIFKVHAKWMYSNLDDLNTTYMNNNYGVLDTIYEWYLRWSKYDWWSIWSKYNIGMIIKMV